MCKERRPDLEDIQFDFGRVKFVQKDVQFDMECSIWFEFLLATFISA